MNFVEFPFLLFLPVVWGGYWALRSNGARKGWLLAASYVFYGAWDWRFLLLILASTGVDYVAGVRLDRPGARRKAWLALTLTANLGLLATFKYLDFFLGSAAALLQSLGLQANVHVLGLILPVGISFYTFQTLSYTLDVYAGRLKATRSLLDFALFVAFFPQLVAGPIVRARDFLPQLDAPRRFGAIDVRGAAFLFLVGFVKKACVADNLALPVDAFFAHPASYGALGAWTALFFYAAQIYCDFSGYSDMAIAIAALFGYRLCLNFHHPYLATNLSDFWRRWHISLSTWLRDYLFIPLGGSRGGLARTLANLLVTFFLCGLWHGAAWNFVAWGMVHGLGLCVRLLWRRFLPEDGFARRATALLGWPMTLVFVVSAWAFFRTNVSDALLTLRIAFGLHAAGPETFGWLAVALVGALGLAHVAAYRRAGEAFARLPGWAAGLAFGLLFAVALAFVPANPQPFIYFQF